MDKPKRGDHDKQKREGEQHDKQGGHNQEHGRKPGRNAMAKVSQDRSRPPHWPTLEEQLAAMKVRPGSALEKLIRDNQDFDLLYPEEAYDQLPYPPWLRVYWRKAHPEVDWYRTVAYPLILKEIGGWMRRHQDLPVQGAEGTRKHSPNLNDANEGGR